MRCSGLIALALMAGTASAAPNEKIEHVVTQTSGEAGVFEGSEYREIVNQAVRHAASHESDAAWSKLQPVLAYCDSKTDTADKQFISVASKEESAEAMAAHAGKSSLVLIDRACPSAYKTAGFLSVEAGDSKRALEFLIRAESLSPYWAAPYVEHAYLLRESGDIPNSLLLYRRALAIAEKYPGSAEQKAIALRGIGFDLTELGDLDGAQKAYEDSLTIEPANELAKNELAYIAQLRAQK